MRLTNDLLTDADDGEALSGGETLGLRIALGRTGGNGNHQWFTARLISGTVTESGRLTGLLRQAACLGHGGRTIFVSTDERWPFRFLERGLEQPMDDGCFDFATPGRNISGTFAVSTT